MALEQWSASHSATSESLVVRIPSVCELMQQLVTCRLAPFDGAMVQAHNSNVKCLYPMSMRSRINHLQMCEVAKTSNCWLPPLTSSAEAAGLRLNHPGQNACLCDLVNPSPCPLG